LRILALAVLIAFNGGAASAAPHQATHAPAKLKAARGAGTAPPAHSSPDIGSPEWLQQQAVARAEERRLQDVMKLCRC
jgi:hypothetical protein